MIPYGGMNESLVLHRSRDLEYRTPFGAVSCGTHVRLSIDAPEGHSCPILCYSYGLYTLSYHESVTKRSESDPKRYEITVRMPAEPCLFFYWFKMIRNDPANIDGAGESFYYVRSSKDRTGAGRISRSPARVGADEHRSPHAFQITVYDEDLSTPDWMKGALIYQIFPDRFSRSSDFSYDEMSCAHHCSDHIYHRSWDEDVDIRGKPETGYVACDFFGGSLKGIAEKANHLEQLNIELIYLNPIFKARSNHRYDTGDYLEIDPLLGGDSGFEYFNEEMTKRKIRFVLDGVFSHTGADSRYFNKYGRYPERGAYQALTEGGASRYFSWYSFSKSKSGEILYDSWWGFPELPNVNENDLSFREFILGDEGVIAHWIRKGASGFRLDVSDELPDSFIRELHRRVRKETDGEGVVLGEVWEDASNKVSYGAYRDFVLGRTHDSIMGYPFKDAVIGFLNGSLPARETNHLLETYRENYPAQIYYCVMNLLSSHDVPRAITALSGVKDPGDRQKQRDIFLTDEQRALAMRLMRLGFVFQMGYVGCPAVYYGDEIGMEGFRDPFNRRTYPWGKITEEQRGQLDFFCEISCLRKRFPVLKTGFYRTLIADEDVFVFERTLDRDGRDRFGVLRAGPYRMIFAFNRNRNHSMTFFISEKHPSHAATSAGDSDLPAFVESMDAFEGRTELDIGPIGFRIFASGY
ncbi:MAG: glycoside hydrolase family 13 protein [Clostridiales bacterium]|nr:glycoside hydrolase family 13 protein [Clostridiales bacterium]